jgi:ubiquitin carboxyl-terminal hydrolase 7
MTLLLILVSPNIYAHTSYTNTLTEKKLEEEARFKEERRKEREEQHLYILARVVTRDTYMAHSGTDLATWDDPERDNAAARSYRVLKTSAIQDLATLVARDLNEDPRKLRFWCMVNRQNKTVRPDQPILDSKMTIEDVHQKLVGVKQQDVRLWAEVAEELDPIKGEPIWPTLTSQHPSSQATNQQNIVLFLKWFDVENQRLVGQGHLYIGKDRKVEELVPHILKRMGWPEKNAAGEKTSLKLFEEIKPQMIDQMKAKQTLKAAELQDGDIVCFQRGVEKVAGSDTE